MAKMVLSIVIIQALFLITLPQLQAQNTIKAPADTSLVLTINNFGIPQLNRQRTLFIWLPKDYKTSNKRYPVLYMQDGEKLFQRSDSNQESWGIDSVLCSHPINQQCIIVGVSSGKHRITEYNPFDSDYGVGEGMAYSKFMVETLKPYMDKNYRTKPDARHTAIAGSSMGALIAMYAAYKYPETFGAAGVFSPAFWISPNIYQEIKTNPANQKSRYYFTCGDDEGNEEEYVNRMDSLLHSKGLSFKQVPLPVINKGEKHNEQQWRKAFPVFYDWLIQKF